MSLLLETIRVVNKTFQNLTYHQQRLESTMKKIFPDKPVIVLSEELQVPENLDDGVYKCRILYDEKIRKTEFIPYFISPVRSLTLVEISPQIDYSFKWAERTWIEKLKKKFATDDILMSRNGMLTDTSYANIALWDGSRWFTPARPLLAGTCRARLLDKGILQTTDISLRDLKDFQSIKLLNAMMEFEEAPVIEVKNVQIAAP